MLLKPVLITVVASAVANAASFDVSVGSDYSTSADAYITYFDPPKLTVNVSDTITFRIRDNQPHLIIHGRWCTPATTPAFQPFNGNQAIVFTIPDSYEVYDGYMKNCKYGARMEIIVRDPYAQPPPPPPPPPSYDKNDKYANHYSYDSGYKSYNSWYEYYCDGLSFIGGHGGSGGSGSGGSGSGGSGSGGSGGSGSGGSGSGGDGSGGSGSGGSGGSGSGGSNSGGSGTGDPNTGGNNSGNGNEAINGTTGGSAGNGTTAGNIGSDVNGNLGNSGDLGNSNNTTLPSLNALDNSTAARSVRAVLGTAGVTALLASVIAAA